MHPKTEYVVKVFEIDIELVGRLTLECVNNCSILGFHIHNV